MIDLGPLIDIHDCADKCCQHDNCEVAHIRDNKCYAVDCYTKDLCQSFPVDNLDPQTNAIVYMNKRSEQRQRNKGMKKIISTLKWSEISGAYWVTKLYHFEINNFGWCENEIYKIKLIRLQANIKNNVRIAI